MIAWQMIVWKISVWSDECMTMVRLFQNYYIFSQQISYLANPLYWSDMFTGYSSHVNNLIYSQLYHVRYLWSLLIMFTLPALRHRFTWWRHAIDISHVILVNRAWMLRSSLAQRMKHRCGYEGILHRYLEPVVSVFFLMCSVWT